MATPSLSNVESSDKSEVITLTDRLEGTAAALNDMYVLFLQIGQWCFGASLFGVIILFLNTPFLFNASLFIICVICVFMQVYRARRLYRLWESDQIEPTSPLLPSADPISPLP